MDGADIPGPCWGSCAEESRDLLLWQVKLGVIKSLKPMLNLLLPNDDLREQVYDYIPLLLAEYQGSLEALCITQVRAKRAAAPAEALETGVPGDCHLGGR